MMKGFILMVIISIIAGSKNTQRFDYEIDVNNPNYNLLNEALFKAANEVRISHGLSSFIKHPLLQKVAESHAFQMINKDFYSHKNPFDANQRSVLDRINFHSKNKNSFTFIAENIAHYDVLDTQDPFCVKKTNTTYYYFNCEDKKPIPVFTYKNLARTVLRDWMKSPGHRENLLDPKYKYLGTAAQLSKNPFTTKTIPFARLVENFGG